MNPDAMCEQIFNNISQEDEKLDKQIIKQLSCVFTGMQGRFTRFRIICALQDTPMNPHQLAKKLDLDYKTIQHNLKVLMENNLVEKAGSGYGDMYFISELLLSNLSELAEVIKKVEARLSSKKVYL